MDISLKGAASQPELCPSCQHKTLPEFQHCGHCGHDLHDQQYHSLASQIKDNFIFYAATASSLIAGIVMVINQY